MRSLKIGIISFLFCFSAVSVAKPIVIGSKDFTESYILAEIMALFLKEHGYDIQTTLGLGGTVVCYTALQNGEIDIYPEYSGTIEQVILKSPRRLTYAQIQKQIKARKLRLLESFGFNNTYAIAVSVKIADRLDLKNISDLKNHPDLRGSLSHEFLERKDGWKNLASAYQLQEISVTGIQHSLAYDAIQHGKSDFTDAYSTDPKIERFHLRVLKDDQSFFPIYNAAPFVREGLPSDIYRILSTLGHSITEAEMIRLNAQAEYDKKGFKEIAYDFLSQRGFIADSGKTIQSQFAVSLFVKRTLVHLYMTFVAVLFATGVAVPLALFLYYTRRLAQPILVAAGLLQTIPSIALLAFMIPLFGIGMKPAIAALFLYSLLPILRNTYTALTTISPALKEAALGIGLHRYESLYFVELPLSLPVIVAGIRITAVINIGTATLAAFIGAGGLGEPIVTGLALNDTHMILAGAIPAALLAIVIELFLEAIERFFQRKYGASS